MPRFVILEHDHPTLHWDLMLEAGEVLRTWRLTAPPEVGRTVAAELIADHRRMYLDYEGPVSGNRGWVKRWDGGTYTGELPMTAASGEQVVVELAGERIHRRLVLQLQGDGRWVVMVSGEVVSGEW